MNDEKREMKPEESKPAETKGAERERVSDKEFAELLSQKLKFEELMKMLPQMRTSDGDLVKGVEWLDPKRESQRNEFLKKPEFAKQRRLLAERLKLWVEALSASDDPDAVRKVINEKMTKLEANLDKNMKHVLDAGREVETTYRAIDKFFTNAQREPDEKVNAWFANASVEELLDPNDREKFETLAKAISDLYREFSIKECFSIAVIPGWLGSVENVDTVARQLGLPNKVHVITDLPNLEKFDEVMDMLENPVYASMAGIDDYKQYVSMWANWVMARESSQYEDEDLWIPPSSVVAGLIYQRDSKGDIHQPSAGFKFGKIADAKYLRFRANQPDASKIIAKGVNTMVNFEGAAVAMGAATLSTKETFNVYSIRRTYDYVYKALRNYLNKQAFAVIDENFIRTLKDDLLRFLQKNTGPGKILDGSEVNVFADQEMRRRQEVDIKVSLNPRYPARTFNIEFLAWNQDNKTNVKDK